METISKPITDPVIEVGSDIEVGSRVKLSGSNLRGTIVDFLPPKKEEHRPRILWRVKWDNGQIGVCETDDLEPLND